MHAPLGYKSLPKGTQVPQLLAPPLLAPPLLAPPLLAPPLERRSISPLLRGLYQTSPIQG